MLLIQAFCVFQSSPSFEAGRYPALLTLQGAFDGFQSSPSFEAGRYQTDREIARSQKRSNPHPALRLGATDKQCLRDSVLDVPILTQL